MSMTEVEAHELECVIQQKAPFFETTVLPACRYDEYAESVCGTYEVAIMTDAFSLEIHSFDDWIRLFGAVQQISGTKELTPTALEVWMQSESEKVAATENNSPDWVMTDESPEDEDEPWSVVYDDDPAMHKKQTLV